MLVRLLLCCSCFLLSQRSTAVGQGGSSASTFATCLGLVVSTLSRCDTPSLRCLDRKGDDQTWQFDVSDESFWRRPRILGTLVPLAKKAQIAVNDNKFGKLLEETS